MGFVIQLTSLAKEKNHSPVLPPMIQQEFSFFFSQTSYFYLSRVVNSHTHTHTPFISQGVGIQLEHSNTLGCTPNGLYKKQQLSTYFIHTPHKSGFIQICGEFCRKSSTWTTRNFLVFYGYKLLRINIFYGFKILENHQARILEVL